jgi:hypothetical protein
MVKEWGVVVREGRLRCVLGCAPPFTMGIEWVVTHNQTSLAVAKKCLFIFMA